MNPSTTFVINVLGKDLPWRSSRSQFSSEMKNIATLDRWDTIRDTMLLVSERKPDIKDIIIDDAGFIMTNEFFSRARESGLS